MKAKSQTHKRIKFHPSKKSANSEMLEYTGVHTNIATTIEIITFDETSYRSSSLDLATFIAWEPEEHLQHWVNITGISDTESIKNICLKYNIHYLYQEDIMNIHQRPKLDEENNYIYTSFKELTWDIVTNIVEEEQYSIILFCNTILTFQEVEGDHFDSIREKLKNPDSYYRDKKVDYLFYRFFDITTDNYFDVLENLGNILEKIEDEIMHNARPYHLERIQDSKKDIMQIRKNIFPVREILSKVISSENHCINDKNKKYFKDILDHVIQIIDTTETYREINISLKDIYLNAQSHEMNRVMKVLTIISTFFIPLTFLVGVYGMNFENMPELKWQNGYYYLWGLMIAVVICLSIWFKRKGWF
jgi:magnesium transporter